MAANNLVGRIIDGRFPLLEALESIEAGDLYRTQLAGAEPQRAALRLQAASEEQATAWKLAGSFSHPHLQRIFAGGRAEVDGRRLLYLVTELPEESLSQVLPDRPLTAAEAAEMLPPMLDALVVLHEGGAVHTAIRPANVLVIGDQVKLSIASVCGAGSTHQPSPSDPHDAPELGKGSLAPASDIWSLGSTLVEALTQKLPSSSAAIPQGVPAPFDAIARQCLQSDPAKRGTAKEIRRQLQPESQHPAPAVPVVPVANTVPIVPDPRQRPVAIKVEPLVQPARPAQALLAATPARNRVPLYTAGGAAAVILLLVLILHGRNSAPDTAPATTVNPPIPAPVTASAPVSAPATAAPVGNSRGSVADRVMPDIPARASQSIHGTVAVLIKVSVDSGGAVTSASIESHGQSRYFADHALDAARKWSFKPPQSGGQPQPSTWSLRFRFRRDHAEVDAVQLKP